MLTFSGAMASKCSGTSAARSTLVGIGRGGSRRVFGGTGLFANNLYCNLANKSISVSLDSPEMEVKGSEEVFAGVCWVSGVGRLRRVLLVRKRIGAAKVVHLGNQQLLIEC